MSWFRYRTRRKDILQNVLSRISGLSDQSISTRSLDHWDGSDQYYYWTYDTAQHSIYPMHDERPSSSDAKVPQIIQVVCDFH